MPVLPGFTVPMLSVIYWIIAAVALVAGIAAHILGRGWFGRWLLAVRDSEAGAASIGIPVARTKLMALTLARRRRCLDRRVRARYVQPRHPTGR
jgi:ABC-type branched-subunit amino acid transport system permease subunit